MYSDRRIQVEDTAQALGMTHGSVSKLLHDSLGMLKLTARWVPKSLCEEIKGNQSISMQRLVEAF